MSNSESASLSSGSVASLTDSDSELTSLYLNAGNISALEWIDCNGSEDDEINVTNFGVYDAGRPIEEGVGGQMSAALRESGDGDSGEECKEIIDTIETNIDSSRNRNNSCSSSDSYTTTEEFDTVISREMGETVQMNKSTQRLSSCSSTTYESDATKCSGEDSVGISNPVTDTGNTVSPRDSVKQEVGTFVNDTQKYLTMRECENRQTTRDGTCEKEQKGECEIVPTLSTILESSKKPPDIVNKRRSRIPVRQMNISKNKTNECRDKQENTTDVNQGYVTSDSLLFNSSQTKDRPLSMDNTYSKTNTKQTTDTEKQNNLIKNKLENESSKYTNNGDKSIVQYTPTNLEYITREGLSDIFNDLETMDVKNKNVLLSSDEGDSSLSPRIAPIARGEEDGFSSELLTSCTNSPPPLSSAYEADEDTYISDNIILEAPVQFRGPVDTSSVQNVVTYSDSSSDNQSTDRHRVRKKKDLVTGFLGDASQKCTNRDSSPEVDSTAGGCELIAGALVIVGCGPTIGLDTVMQEEQPDGHINTPSHVKQYTNFVLQQSVANMTCLEREVGQLSITEESRSTFESISDEQCRDIWLQNEKDSCQNDQKCFSINTRQEMKKTIVESDIRNVNSTKNAEKDVNSSYKVSDNVKPDKDISITTEIKQYNKDLVVGAVRLETNSLRQEASGKNELLCFDIVHNLMYNTIEPAAKQYDVAYNIIHDGGGISNDYTAVLTDNGLMARGVASGEITEDNDQTQNNYCFHSVDTKSLTCCCHSQCSCQTHKTYRELSRPDQECSLKDPNSSRLGVIDTDSKHSFNSKANKLSDSKVEEIDGNSVSNSKPEDQMKLKTDCDVMSCKRQCQLGNYHRTMQCVNCVGNEQKENRIITNEKILSKDQTEQCILVTKTLEYCDADKSEYVIGATKLPTTPKQCTNECYAKERVEKRMLNSSQGGDGAVSAANRVSFKLEDTKTVDGDVINTDKNQQRSRNNDGTKIQDYMELKHCLQELIDGTIVDEKIDNSSLCSLKMDKCKFDEINPSNNEMKYDQIITDLDQKEATRSETFKNSTHYIVEEVATKIIDSYKTNSKFSGSIIEFSESKPECKLKQIIRSTENKLSNNADQIERAIDINFKITANESEESVMKDLNNCVINQYKLQDSTNTVARKYMLQNNQSIMHELKNHPGTLNNSESQRTSSDHNKLQGSKQNDLKETVKTSDINNTVQFSNNRAINKKDVSEKYTVENSQGTAFDLKEDSVHNKLQGLTQNNQNLKENNRETVKTSGINNTVQFSNNRAINKKDVAEKNTVESSPSFDLKEVSANNLVSLKSGDDDSIYFNDEATDVGAGGVDFLDKRASAATMATHDTDVTFHKHCAHDHVTVRNNGYTHNAGTISRQKQCSADNSAQQYVNRAELALKPSASVKIYDAHVAKCASEKRLDTPQDVSVKVCTVGELKDGEQQSKVVDARQAENNENVDAHVVKCASKKRLDTPFTTESVPQDASVYTADALKDGKQKSKVVDARQVEKNENFDDKNDLQSKPDSFVCTTACFGIDTSRSKAVLLCVKDLKPDKIGNAGGSCSGRNSADDESKCSRGQETEFISKFVEIQPSSKEIVKPNVVRRVEENDQGHTQAHHVCTLAPRRQNETQVRDTDEDCYTSTNCDISDELISGKEVLIGASNIKSSLKRDSPKCGCDLKPAGDNCEPGATGVDVTKNEKINYSESINDLPATNIKDDNKCYSISSVKTTTCVDNRERHTVEKSLCPHTNEQCSASVVTTAASASLQTSIAVGDARCSAQAPLGSRDSAAKATCCKGPSSVIPAAAGGEPRSDVVYGDSAGDRTCSTTGVVNQGDNVNTTTTDNGALKWGFVNGRLIFKSCEVKTAGDTESENGSRLKNTSILDVIEKCADRIEKEISNCSNDESVPVNDILSSRDLNKRSFDRRSRLKRLENKLKEAGIVTECPTENAGKNNSIEKHEEQVVDKKTVVNQSKQNSSDNLDITADCLNKTIGAAELSDVEKREPCQAQQHDDCKLKNKSSVENGVRSEEVDSRQLSDPNIEHYFGNNNLSGCCEFDVNRVSAYGGCSDSDNDFYVVYDEYEDDEEEDPRSASDEDDEEHYHIISCGINASATMRGDGDSGERMAPVKRHNPDHENLKSLLKKPGKSKDNKKNRVVFNEKRNEFFDADYIILIREECDYDEEDDDGVCTCNQHEMVRLTCCEPNCNCNSYDGYEQTPPSPKFAPPIEFVDAVTLSPPEGYKDMDLGEHEIAALQQLARQRAQYGVCRDCSGQHRNDSAVTVRYLTKRYIGEYSSMKDLLYQQKVNFEGVSTEVEILDTSNCAKNGCLYEHIRWGEAFVIVYSVCDRHSFLEAHDLLAQLAKLKVPSYYTAVLLGNKRDLDHFRQICVDDGQELSLEYGCQFYEVSTAENCTGVQLAFQSLLREARAVQLLRSLPVRRRIGVNSVSKVLGNIFGKNSNKTNGDRKKRPSLSI